MKAKVRCKWNGYEFESITAAALALHVSYNTMLKRIRNGQTCDDDARSRFHGIACEWNGKHWWSVSACARANHISEQGMAYRLRRGYRSDKDMRRLASNHE